MAINRNVKSEYLALIIRLLELEDTEWGWGENYDPNGDVEYITVYNSDVYFVILHVGDILRLKEYELGIIGPPEVVTDYDVSDRPLSDPSNDIKWLQELIQKLILRR